MLSARKRLTARVVDRKRHTIGFVANNNTSLTRGEAVKLAKRNQLVGVVAKKGQDGWYVSSLPDSSVRLSDLPMVVRD